jgi:hypothetical protein
MFLQPYTSDATLLIREVTNKKLTKGCWRSDLDIEELDDSREVDVSYKVSFFFLHINCSSSRSILN